VGVVKKIRTQVSNSLNQSTNSISSGKKKKGFSLGSASNTALGDGEISEKPPE
jgi:hypothetical protein